MTERCLECKFFAQIGPEVGNCRRYPPRPWPHGDKVSALWPVVRCDQWCGEWRRAVLTARDMPQTLPASIQ